MIRRTVRFETVRQGERTFVVATCLRCHQPITTKSNTSSECACWFMGHVSGASARTRDTWRFAGRSRAR